MKYIELSEAIAIHEKIIEKTGGLSGYNETQIGYLASALEHIKNDDYYPTITDKVSNCELNLKMMKKIIEKENKKKP